MTYWDIGGHKLQIYLYVQIFCHNGNQKLCGEKLLSIIKYIQLIAFVWVLFYSD